jgi:hypothetical protein
MNPRTALVRPAYSSQSVHKEARRMRILQIPAVLVAALIATLVILTAGSVQASNPPKHAPTSPEMPAPLAASTPTAPKTPSNTRAR